MYKKVPMEEIAEMLEEEIVTIKPIYGLLQEHTDWDNERVYKELIGRNVSFPKKVTQNKGLRV